MTALGARGPGGCSSAVGGADFDADTDTVFDAAARTGTALEINAFPDRLDLDDELVRGARDRGVLFAIDTDAHAIPTPGLFRSCAGSSPRDAERPAA